MSTSQELAQAEHDKKCIITDGNTISIKNMSIGFIYYTKAKIVDNEIVVYYTKELIIIKGATKNCKWGGEGLGDICAFMGDIVEYKIANFDYIRAYVAGESMSVDWNCNKIYDDGTKMYGYHPDTIIRLTIVPITSQLEYKAPVPHPHC